MKKLIIAACALFLYSCAQDPVQAPATPEQNPETRAISVGSITPATQWVLINSTPTLLTASAASGGTAPYTYQWQSSTNGSTWTNISGATGLSYQPQKKTSLNIDYYRLWYYDRSNQQAYSASARVIPTLSPPTLWSPHTYVLADSDWKVYVSASNPNSVQANVTYEWQTNGGYEVASPYSTSAAAWLPTGSSATSLYVQCRVNIGGVVSDWAGISFTRQY